MATLRKVFRINMQAEAVTKEKWYAVDCVCQSSIRSFQHIVFKFCVMVDINTSSSWFNLSENQIKVKVTPKVKIYKNVLFKIFMDPLLDLDCYC